jgi:acyl-coenzyme A synthetase/AMP-(fatty) acid ligase
MVVFIPKRSLSLTKNSVIQRAGLLAGPEKVEAVIMKHPAVTKAAVIRLKD